LAYTGRGHRRGLGRRACRCPAMSAGLRCGSASGPPTLAQTDRATPGLSMLSAGIEARPCRHESRRDLLPRPGTGLRARARVRKGDGRHVSPETSASDQAEQVQWTAFDNGLAERLIGSIRRDCLDHVVIFNEQHLRHLLKCYKQYYNEISYAPIARQRPADSARRREGRARAPVTNLRRTTPSVCPRLNIRQGQG
jgi:hypothetical protein